MNSAPYTQLQTNLLNISPYQRNTYSNLIKRNVLFLPRIQQARTIGIFPSYQYNMHIQPLINSLKKQGKQIEHLPSPPHKISSHLDAIIIPCIAADLNGRIFYTKSNIAVPRHISCIALSFSHQITSLSVTHISKPADTIVTEHMVHQVSTQHSCRFINGNAIAETKIITSHI